jgi:chromosome segregation ATPase
LEALKKEIEASKANAAETEKKRAGLATQFDARTKERDTLAAEKQALDARLSALAADHENLGKLAHERQTALEALKKEIEASKANAAETEKKRAELATQFDARTKERDQFRTERDNLVKERDQLKKTAGDRASRIAELEARVADQAERQKLIDEQMVRAETQLEMLKEFLQPAFQ